MTTQYEMSLLRYVLTFKTSDSDFYTGFDSKEDEAADLLKNEKAEMQKCFQEFAKSFCDKKNLLGNGVYSFVSFENDTFTYSITK